MTWKLVSQSFRILRNDPKLLLFPVLSAIGVVALSVPFFLALFGLHIADGLHFDRWGASSWLLVLLWYWGAAFVTVFFNCALAACVQMQFAGQEPTIGEGLSRAVSRIHVILAWSLVSASVGRILELIQSRSGLVGRIVVMFVGMGWSLATFLIVPVVVMEEQGVMDSIRRSAALLRQTWGEQIISGFAFGWIGLLFAIPGVVLGALGVNGYPIFLVPTVLWFAALIAAFAAASEIFTVVLYRYATSGQAPDGYDAATLNGAFKRR
jgi:hypothetical protein